MTAKVTVRVRATRADVRRALASVPALLSGRRVDVTGESRAAQVVLGQVLLSLVKESFLAKSRGGADEAGDRWAPLSPATVKARRRSAGGEDVEVLRDTGQLFNSLGPALDHRPGVAAVGTNLPKARWLHEGTKTIPARRLWPEPRRFPPRWRGEIALEARQCVVRLILRLLGGLP